MTIYFIQPEGEPFVKIGLSQTAVAQRVAALQCANHRKLHVIAKRSGGYKYERAFHQLFKAHRVHGEWFRLTKEVADVVAKVKDGTYRLPIEDKAIAAAKRDAANSRRGPHKDKGRMPWDQAAKFYFDPLLSNDELEKIVAKGFAPMSYHTMWRHFGKKRGAIVGRPSAARRATK